MGLISKAEICSKEYSARNIANRISNRKLDILFRNQAKTKIKRLLESTRLDDSHRTMESA